MLPTTFACRYWQLQLPMFVVAVSAAVTGLAAAACYIYIFASDSAEETFLKGRLQPGTASPVFISLLVLQPLEFFSYVSSIVMLQLRMVDLCFNRQASGARNRAVSRRPPLNPCTALTLILLIKMRPLPRCSTPFLPLSPYA